MRVRVRNAQNWESCKAYLWHFNLSIRYAELFHAPTADITSNKFDVRLDLDANSESILIHCMRFARDLLLGVICTREALTLTSLAPTFWWNWWYINIRIERREKQYGKTIPFDSKAKTTQKQTFTSNYFLFVSYEISSLVFEIAHQPPVPKSTCGIDTIAMNSYRNLNNRRSRWYSNHYRYSHRMCFGRDLLPQQTRHRRQLQGRIP